MSMSSTIELNHLIDNLLRDNFEDTEDDIEYYEERITDLKNQINEYKKLYLNAKEHEKQHIEHNLYDMMCRKNDYIKKLDNLQIQNNNTHECEPIFQFDD